MLTIISFLIFGGIVLLTGRLNDSSNATIEFSLSRHYTNALRGLAILMITCGHVAGQYGESRWWSPLPAIGVTLFLFLSGFGNHESRLKRGRWEARKLLNIAIPYWVVRTIVLGFYHDNIDPVKLLLDYTFIEINSGFWFVGYIMKWYVAFWLALKYFPKYRYLFWTVLAIVSFIFYDHMVAIHSFDFLLGIIISENKSKLAAVNPSSIIRLGISLPVMFVIALGVKQLTLVRESEMLFRLVDFVTILSGASACVLLAWRSKRLCSSSFLLWLSPITYEVYLVQMRLLRFIQPTSTQSLIVESVLFYIVLGISAIALHKINSLISSRIGFAKPCQSTCSIK